MTISNSPIPRLHPEGRGIPIKELTPQEKALNATGLAILNETAKLPGKAANPVTGAVTVVDAVSKVRADGADGNKAKATKPGAAADLPKLETTKTETAVTAPTPAAEIVWRDPISLKIHPERHRIPPSSAKIKSDMIADMKMNGFRPGNIIQLNAAGEVLKGQSRTDCAVSAGVKQVPCIVVSMPVTDELAYMIQMALTTKLITEDQRAVLAYIWQKECSKRRTKERASKGGKAKAAAMAPDDRCLSVVSTDKQDSRREAAEMFTLPEHKLKDIRHIDSHLPARLATIASGQDTISKVKAIITKKLEKKILSEREEAAKSIPDAEEWRMGSMDVVLREETGFAAVFLYGGEKIAEAMKSLKGEKRCHILAFVSRAELGTAVTALNVADATVNCNPLIWDHQSSLVQDGVRGEYSFIVWATIGDRRSLSNPHGDPIDRVLRSKPRKGDGIEPPEELLAELIEHCTVPGERVVAPYGSEGRVVLAARAKARRALAIADSEGLYVAGKLLIAEEDVTK